MRLIESVEIPLDQIPSGCVPVGGQEMDERISALMGRIKGSAQVAIRIAWQGTKIPLGFNFLGQEVAWMQNGMITGADGSHLGYYSRIEEWGGPDRDRHEAILWR